MQFGFFPAACLMLMGAACSSGYSAGTIQQAPAPSGGFSNNQPGAVQAAGGRYDPATDTFVPASHVGGSSAVLNSTASSETLSTQITPSSTTAPTAQGQTVCVFFPSVSPAGEVPLLVQTCIRSVSGAFGTANGLAQQGYKLQRASESRRKFHRKFPVSTVAALNGSHRSSGLELRANPRRSENYCSIKVTTNESPGSVTAALRSTLANAGFREIGSGTWSNGSRHFKVSQFLSGSRVAWTTSVKHY